MKKSQLKKIITAYKEYVDLLAAEIDELVSFAITHEWKSTRYKAGKRLRAKIKELEEKDI